ncbi:MAG: winged helix-turn-helix domain-containing protein, partial [Terriglobales bacterium]
PQISGTNNMLECRDVVLNTVTHIVTRSGVPVKLMPKEFALLEFLLKHQDQVLSADALLDRVWPSSSDMSPESVRVYVARLRKKLGDVSDESPLLRTVHGVGYKLCSR